MEYIYEKIIKREEISTCKLEAWHNRLDKVLMKPHPSFEEFCNVVMGEWVKIDYDLGHLEFGYEAQICDSVTQWPKRKGKTGSIMLPWVSIAFTQLSII